MQHMKVAVSLTAGLALLAAACGSSKGSTGTTGGTSTAGAGPTTGGGTSSGTTTTGGTTAAGTTSGGNGTTGGLVAGAPCTANLDCLSKICGGDGSGNCCRGPERCVVADGGNPTCDAAGCDLSGACVYPDAGTVCGPETCSGTNYVPAPTCNGSGACDTAEGYPCPGLLACSDAGECLTSCASSADCFGQLPCNAGVCSMPTQFGPAPRTTTAPRWRAAAWAPTTAAMGAAAGAATAAIAA